MPLIRSRMGLGGRFWAGEKGLLKHEGTKVPGRGGAGLLRRVAPRWCWGRIAGEGLPGEAPGKPGPCGVRQGVSGNRGAWCSKSGLWKSPGFEWNPQCGRATPVSVSRPDRSPMGADTSPTPAHLPRFQGDYLETSGTGDSLLQSSHIGSTLLSLRKRDPPHVSPGRRPPPKTYL